MTRSRRPTVLALSAALALALTLCLFLGVRSPAPAQAHSALTPDETAALVAAADLRDSSRALASAAAAAASTSAPTSGPGPEGDLIELVIDRALVGVLLDDFPAGPVREEAAAYFLAKPDSFWSKRAQKQALHAQYRLTFRRLFFPKKRSLQLPGYSEAANDFQVAFFANSPARRVRVGTHDYVARNYTLSATIVGKKGTAVVADKKFGSVGGVVVESFEFPVDPTLLFQRTGFACADEDQFPVNSVAAETLSEIFYDDACEAGPGAPKGFKGTCLGAAFGCHCSHGSDYSCVDALDLFVGRVRVDFKFTRVAWDEARASAVEARSAKSMHTVPLDPTIQGADMIGYEPALDQAFFFYRYFAQNSCEAAECLSGHGYRRLLTFSGMHVNRGLEYIDVLKLNYDQTNLKTLTNKYLIDLSRYGLLFSECHQHMHFNSYASFATEFVSGAGRNKSTGAAHKQGFCLQDVSRIINSRYVPISSKYDTCLQQGISPGFGDLYQAFLPCQWVDVTPLSSGPTGPARAVRLIQDSNFKNALCEGTPVLNAKGKQVWEETGEVTTTPPFPKAGLPMIRRKCDRRAGAYDNNVDDKVLTLPGEGRAMLTSPCTSESGSFGPKRDCDFRLLRPYAACTPGSTVKLRCSVPAASKAQVVRVCESSTALRSGTACLFNDSLFNQTLANVVVEPGKPQTFEFPCPAKRDELELGGRFSWYAGMLLNRVNPSAASADASCAIVAAG